MISLLSLTVSAAELEYSISPDDSFTAVKSGEDLSTIAGELNIPTEELDTYFKQNEIDYFAISKDTKSQIKISLHSNDFSKQVSDISLLDDAALDEFAKTFNVDSNNIINSNDRKFICIIDNQEYSDGIYTITQFITICDNKIVYFTGYNNGKETSKEITAAFSSFKLNDHITADNTTNYTLWIILSIIGIVIFVVAAVVIIISIIRLKNSKEEDENEQ